LPARQHPEAPVRRLQILDERLSSAIDDEVGFLFDIALPQRPDARLPLPQKPALRP